MKILKPIYYYHVQTGNRGDLAIKESIVSSIQKQINIPFSFFNVKYDELTEQRIINDLNKNASALMIAGSGLYSNCSATKSRWYFNCDTNLFSKITVPIILIGLGCNNNLKSDIFGGELTDKAKQSIKLINDLAVISTVRDQRTYDILKNIGVTNHELMLDPACYLNAPRTNKEKKVAINIAQHAPLLGRFDGEKEGQKNREKNLKNFAKISNYLIEKGYSVVFVAHDALEQSLIIDLKKLVPELKYLNTDNINRMLIEYAKCEFTICVKMHSAILSFAVGTPFINIYYDQKSIEFLKMIKCTELGISIFSDYCSTTSVELFRVLESLNVYKLHFNKIKEYYQLKFDNLIIKICQLIKENETL